MYSPAVSPVLAVVLRMAVNSPWPAAQGMPWPGLPSLSVNPTGLVVHGHLAGLAVSLPGCGRNKGNSLLVHGSGCLFSLCTLFQALYMLLLSRDGKMSCSALKTGYVHSSLEIILPAEGPVWITLALSSSECLLPSLPNMMPCGGGRARGLSSIHPPEAPPPPGPSAAGRAGASPSLCWRVFQGVLAHVVSIVPGLIACWFALVCPEPRPVPSVGCKSPSSAGRDERTGAGTV